MRGVALTLLAAAVGGCERTPLGEQDLLPASFTIELQATASGGAATAFDRADRLWLRVGDTTHVRLERSIELSAAGTDVRVPIAVPLLHPRETLDIEIELRFRGEPVFHGFAPVELRAGLSARVAIELDPVIHGLRLPDALPLLTSYGDSVRITGATLFATGDTLETVDVVWTSLDPAVVEIVDSVPVARADGSARLIGRIGAFEDTIGVDVYAIVSGIVVTPSATALSVGETRQFAAALFDARGNGIPGRTVLWSSSDPGVIAIDSNGLATGVGPGSARIEASSGDAVEAVELTSLPVGLPPDVGDVEVGAVIGADVDVTVPISPHGSATTVHFEWSTDPDLASSSTTEPETIPAGPGSVDVVGALIGLEPGRVYYVRAIATNASGTTVGVTTSFTTPGDPTDVTLQATTAGATGIAPHGATLNGLVTPAGGADAWFEWGTDPALAGALTTPVQPLAGTTSLPIGRVLGSLSPLTTYYFRAVAANATGSARGAILSFSTPGVSAGGEPTVSTQAATDIGGTRAVLQGVVNPGGAAVTVWFEGGTSADSTTFIATTPQAVSAGSADIPFSFPVTGLGKLTVYHYRAVAAWAGGTVYGEVVEFVTHGPSGN